MSEGEGGKKGGILAATIAGIGMLFARVGDDCARFGAKGGAALGGASVADDVARGASAVGDDALRGVGVGRGVSGFGDDALRGGGRAGALGEATPRGVLPGGAVVDDELRATGLVEESMGAGASRSGEVADEVAKTGLEVTVENLPIGGGDDDEDEGEVGAPGAVPAGVPGGAAGTRTPLGDTMRWLKTSSPTLVPVVPTTVAGYRRVFGKAPPKGDLEGLAGVGESEPKEKGLPEVVASITRWSKTNPVGIVAFASAKQGKDQAIRLALPAGDTIEDGELHRRCLELGTTCVVLACEPAAGARCAWTASSVWMNARGRASEGQPLSMRAFSRALLEERSVADGGAAIAISRVEGSAEGGTQKIVRSRVRPAAGEKGTR